MWFWLSFILLGIFVYLPIGCIIWFLIIAPLAFALKRNWYTASDYVSALGIILLFVAAILVHGGLFGWYDTIEKPDDITISVDDEVKNNFYKYTEKDDAICITVSDKNFSSTTKSHLTDNGDIHFSVKNENAKKARANLKWTIEINGEEYERDTLPAGTETHIFTPSFSLKIGETIAQVTAQNDLGKVVKTVVINKLSTEAECAKAENASPSPNLSDTPLR